MTTTDDPNSAPSLRALAQDHARRRNYPEAIRAYEAFLQVSGNTGANLLAYADLLLLARQPDAARDAVERAMAAGSNDAYAHLIAARCARLNGDYKDAREHLRVAVKKRPDFGDAWQMLLEMEGREALPDLVQQSSRLADNPEHGLRDRMLLAMASGRAYEKLGDYENAFDRFMLGKELHTADQASREVRYDRAETEQLAARARQHFDTAPGSPYDGTNSSEQPMFIVGMPRSGTTLVERILGGLDDVVVGGESESIGVIATGYYWHQERGENVAWSEYANEYWRREQVKPCRRTDKMPHNFWHIGLIAKLFPNAPVVWMRRDPRDVCMSIYSRVFSDGHPYATDLESLAHFYNTSDQLMRHWQQVCGDRIIEVSYEALVDEPEEQTRNIAEHCGLTWVPECLDFHQRIGTSFTYSEMQVREPINRKGIGAWRRYEEYLAPLVTALGKYGLLPPD